MAPTFDVGVVPAATAMSGVAAGLDGTPCAAESVPIGVGCPEVAACVDGWLASTG